MSQSPNDINEGKHLDVRAGDGDLYGVVQFLAQHLPCLQLLLRLCQLSLHLTHPLPGTGQVEPPLLDQAIGDLHNNVMAGFSPGI